MEALQQSGEPKNAAARKSGGKQPAGRMPAAPEDTMPAVVPEDRTPELALAHQEVVREKRMRPAPVAEEQAQPAAPGAQSSLRAAVRLRAYLIRVELLDRINLASSLSRGPP